MSVRRRTWRDGKTGAQKEAWMIDVEFTTPDGKSDRVRKVSPVATRRGAEEYERQLRMALLDGSYWKAAEAKKAPMPTLAEFFPRFVDQHAKANLLKSGTITEYESVFANHLKPRLGDKRLNEITTQDVARLKFDLAKDKRGKTINNVLVALSRCLKAAVEWQLLETLPCQVKLVKVSQSDYEFYEFDQLEELVTAAKREDPRIHAAVLLGAHAGLRSGEMQGLEWGDVDFRRNVITVQRRVHKGNVDSPKNGKLRRIDMTTRLQEALVALPRGLPAARVLLQDSGAPITQRVLERWMGRAQKAAGHPVTNRIHVLRHTFCSHLGMRSAPSIAVKELAGHSSLATTQRYMHLSPAERGRAIGLLEQNQPPFETSAAVRHMDGTTTTSSVQPRDILR